MGREHKRDRERDNSPVEEKRKKKKRSPTPVRSRSNTYSPSPRREIVSSSRHDNERRRDRSRSPIRDPLPPRFGGGGYHGSSSRRFQDNRDKPDPCPCLGVFGMSLHTTEKDLKHLFGRYGEVESVQIVYDRFSGRSRGFGFVYFTSTKDATKAKDHMTDALIDGMKVRVDYSVTRGGGPYRHMNRSPSKSPVRHSRQSRSCSR